MTSGNNYLAQSEPNIIQFENVNEGRSYPFEDNVTAETVDGKVLPDGFISDIHLVIPKGMIAGLSNVYLSGNMLSVCIKVFSGGRLYGAMSIITTKDGFEPYRPFRLEKLTGSEDIGGVITFGNISFPDTVTNYRFEDNKIPFSDSTVARYIPAALRKLIDDRTGECISGDVKIDFSAHILAENTEDGIALRLKSGSSRTLATKCDRNRPVNTCGATPVESINNIKPDENDRIVLWFH